MCGRGSSLRMDTGSMHPKSGSLNVHVRRDDDLSAQRLSVLVCVAESAVHLGYVQPTGARRVALCTPFNMSQGYDCVVSCCECLQVHVEKCDRGSWRPPSSKDPYHACVLRWKRVTVVCLIGVLHRPPERRLTTAVTLVEASKTREQPIGINLLGAVSALPVSSSVQVLELPEVLSKGRRVGFQLE